MGIQLPDSPGQNLPSKNFVPVAKMESNAFVLMQAPKESKVKLGTASSPPSSGISKAKRGTVQDDQPGCCLLGRKRSRQ